MLNTTSFSLQHSIQVNSWLTTENWEVNSAS